MQWKVITLLIVAMVWPKCVLTYGQTVTPSQLRALTGRIPTRPTWALKGSQFAEYVSKMNPQQREQAILSENLQGNLPSFLRKLIPVELKHLDHGKTLRATVFVMPDYLA